MLKVLEMNWKWNIPCRKVDSRSKTGCCKTFGDSNDSFLLDFLRAHNRFHRSYSYNHQKMVAIGSNTIQEYKYSWLSRVDSLKFFCHFVWKLKFAIAVPNQYNRVFIDLRNPPSPPVLKKKYVPGCNKFLQK